ncbi:MAG: hypothetical protein J6S71_01390 [Clostridia bacterium]|nr:hypothetical protein [Clostridia bacterium]
MKNIRIFSLIIALVIMSSLFIACDGGSDITLPPEDGNTTAGVAAENDAYVFVYNNTEVAPHAKMAELINGLGDPTTYEESESCYYQGLDKDYTYPGFKLRTYPMDGVDYVLNVCFVDDSVSTPEGIMLGSTRDEVIAAYGTSFTEQNGSTVYTIGKTELRFRFSDNGVTAIEYWAITD